MVSRLTELLERIRPAGAPGAATDVEPEIDRAAGELRDVERLLTEFDAEADELIGQAQADAERVHADADRRERQIEDGLPQRLAVAGAEVDDSARRRRVEDVSRIQDDAQREIERMNRTAARRLDELVAAAVDRIWALVEVPDRPEGMTGS